MAEKHNNTTNGQPKDNQLEVTPEQENNELDTSEPSEDETGEASASETPTAQPAAVVSSESGSKFGRLGSWCGRHKKSAAMIALVVIIVILAAIPLTRYVIAGTILKQNISVAVMDSQTHQPVSNASLTLAGKTVLTNGQGQASIRVPVGNKTLMLSKKYYMSLSERILVPIRKSYTLQVQLKATGRQVPITVTNKISGQPVSGATIKVLDTDAKTDTNGHATLVLPAAKASLSATVTDGGYNALTATIQVTAQPVAANDLSITPSGSVYFLSNLSGKIDIVKTNLDGTDRKTVLAGTGKEQQDTTELLASRDWKYLALLSSRDGTPKLYLITTATDTLTTMDEGTNVSFELKGWSNDTFMYTVTRSDIPNAQTGQEALKSFNATGQKLATLDQTSASGPADTSDPSFTKEIFGQVFILPNNEVVYVKNVNSSFPNAGGAQAAVYSINADGSSKKTIKSWGAPKSSTIYGIFIDVQLASATSVYIRDPFATPSQFYEYEAGQLKATNDVTEQTFNGGYPVAVLSPSGAQTLWSDVRDGKNVLFLGDSAGQNGKQIASLTDYRVYGWYTDNYLLVSKNGSELYIMPASGSAQPLKVSDYYTALAPRGYGGGYGGF